jgi:hypothetical protein
MSSEKIKEKILKTDKFIFKEKKYLLKDLIDLYEKNLEEKDFLNFLDLIDKIFF